MATIRPPLLGALGAKRRPRPVTATPSPADELMVEYIGDDEGAAPRFVHGRRRHGQAADLFNLRLCSAHGVVHGDLSPYNLPVWGDRFYFIDFPPAVDPIAHPDGLQLLERDVFTCASGRGATVSRATRGRCSPSCWQSGSDPYAGFSPPRRGTEHGPATLFHGGEPL